MRCKVGDTVIVRRSRYNPQYIGRFLDVIAPDPHSVGYWICEPDLPHMNGAKMCWNDNSLIPIRPGESPEESTEAMRLLTQVKEKV